MKLLNKGEEVEYKEYCIIHKGEICDGCCECENKGLNDPFAVLYDDYEEVYGD